MDSDHRHSPWWYSDSVLGPESALHAAERYAVVLPGGDILRVIAIDEYDHSAVGWGDIMRLLHRWIVERLLLY